MDETTLDVADSALGDRRRRFSAAWLRLIHGAGAPRDYRLGSGEHRIGRGAECEVQVPEATLSRLHCAVEVERRRVSLHRASRGKRVWVDGIEVPEASSVRLHDGSLLRLGGALFVLRLDPAEGDFEWGPAPGRSPAMIRLRAQLKLLRDGPEPVLILGETGTGKEFVAQALHGRRRGRFLSFNCSALSDRSLARGELFGARRGAYTGAEDRWGLVKAAEGGTLFLDEVGDLPLDAQPLLLRVVEYGTYHRVGDPQVLRADLRIVAATNVDLHAAVDFDQFRRDLLARLEAGGGTVRLPPLRERREDLPEWVDHFASRAGGARPFDAGFLEALALYRWPANLRELNAVLRRLLQDDPPVLTAALLPEEVQAARAQARRLQPRPEATDVTASTLRRALAEAASFAEAARRLGLSRDQLRRLRHKHGLAE